MATLQFSTGLTIAILDAWCNGGTAISFFDNAVMKIRSGGLPANADAAPIGNVAATMTLPADAMAATSGHTVAKQGTWSDPSADASWTAGHFEIIEAGQPGTGVSAVEKRLRGDVTDTAGSGAMKLDTVTVVATQPVVVSSFQFTLPA